MHRLTLALLVMPLFAASAQTTNDLPPPVNRGLTALQAGQCEAAFREWSIAWTAPEDSAKGERLVSGCAVLSKFGPLNGYDVIRTLYVTPHVSRVYIALLYAKQPVYLMLVAYRSGSDWKILVVNWHTDYDKVIPASLFGAEHPGP